MAAVFLLGFSVQAQNTKGDRPQVKSGSQRESRFRNPFKKKNNRGKASFNRAQAKGVSRASSARKPGKPTKAQKIYPQKGLFVNNPSSKPSNKQKAWRGTASHSRLVVRSKTGKTRNVYPQKGYYVNNPSSKPRETQHPVSNKNTLSRLSRLQSPASPSPPGKKKRIVPRSISKPFMARKSINVYANFHRPKKKGERAVERDIAGRPLRMKNYETPRQPVIEPTFKPYYGRKRVGGDRPYSGPSKGGYRSESRTRPKAWTGDIAGRRVRGENFSSKKKIEGTPMRPPRRKARDRFGDRVYRGNIPGGGYRSASKPGEKRTGTSPIPVRTPGMGANRMGKYQGNLKGRRPDRGGGSVSGKGWNNDGMPVGPSRLPSRSAARASVFTGYKNSRRPIQRDQGEGFTGTLKGRRPAKGGGSVSGKVWNNKGTAIPARAPKTGVMLDGVSPAMRESRRRPNMRDQGEEFTGTLKGRRPAKGGGSVSGKLWNNKETPIPVRTPKTGVQLDGISPAMKESRRRPNMRDQGEEFTGMIRRPRLWKDYIKNENSHEEALKKKRPTDATYAVGKLQIAVKQRDYVKNKNSADEALLKQKPNANTHKVDDLQIKVRQPATAYRKNAPEGALPGLKPSRETVKASEYAKGARRNWDYIHNPSSSDDALKVREPGKAFARSTDYQGNIKMKKFDLFQKNRGLHPDAQFVKTGKSNVDGERDLLTNLKLWWARLFRKNDTQPENLKEKGKKPRYDKGEEGLWYE